MNACARTQATDECVYDKLMTKRGVTLEQSCGRERTMRGNMSGRKGGWYSKAPNGGVSVYVCAHAEIPT